MFLHRIEAGFHELSYLESQYNHSTQYDYARCYQRELRMNPGPHSAGWNRSERGQIKFRPALMSIVARSIFHVPSGIGPPVAGFLGIPGISVAVTSFTNGG